MSSNILPIMSHDGSIIQEQPELSNIISPSTSTNRNQLDVHGQEELSIMTSNMTSNHTLPDGTPHLHGDLVIRASSTKKPELQFENLPVEILEKIVAFTYELAIDELPEFHPLIHNNATDMSPAAVQTRQRRRNSIPPSLNVEPPAHLKDCDRSNWLVRHPGQFNPPFEIMFVSRLFYEISKPIRYREIHLLSLCHTYGDENQDVGLLCSRLANEKIQEFTKNVHLQIYFWQNTQTIHHLIEALKTLPKLKHLCVTIKYEEDLDLPLADRLWGEDEDILKFFDLKIETLTLIWAWDGDRSYLSESYHPNIGDTYAPVASKAEGMMQAIRSDWMEGVYKASSWYNGADENVPILPGKPRHTTDWTATGGGRQFWQWEMDTFTFAGKSTKPRPCWNLWKNPHNHPSQLTADELEGQRPKREWRKGFHAYDEDELMGNMSAGSWTCYQKESTPWYAESYGWGSGGNGW